MKRSQYTEASLTSANRESFRLLRILVLLIVLLLVAVGAWRDRVHSTGWRVPLYVAIYPIPADDSVQSAAMRMWESRKPSVLPSSMGESSVLAKRPAPRS